MNGSGEAILPREEAARLAYTLPVYSRRQLERLYARFMALPVNVEQKIPAAVIMTLPEFEQNPQNAELLAAMGLQRDQQINFEEFLQALQVFHPKTKVDEKARFAFKLYADGKSYITRKDIVRTLSLLLEGTDVTEEELAKVAEKTMQEADVEEEDQIHENEFFNLVANTDIAGQYTIRFY